VATTAGTSGTVFGIAPKPVYDEKFRVNTFIHVNHRPEAPSYGVLLCVNGTGILNSWLKKLLGGNLDYREMNRQAAEAPIGSEGLSIVPFGNGVERIMELREVNAHVDGLDFNRHDRRHLLRAAQEGIVSSLTYGFNIMKGMGLSPTTVKAGHANMFLSPLFREAFVNMNGVSLELYNTDGAQGAARGAGVGSGLFSTDDAFKGLKKIDALDPEPALQEKYREVFGQWERALEKHL
jgi:xylulokinase